MRQPALIRVHYCPGYADVEGYHLSPALSVRRALARGGEDGARRQRCATFAPMSEEPPPYGSPRPIRTSAAALGRALTTLRSIADALEAALRKHVADALVRLAPLVQEFERRAALVLRSS